MLNKLLHINNPDGLQLIVAQMQGVDNLLPQTFYSAQEQEEFDLLKSEKRQFERAATLFILHNCLGIKSALHHDANGCPQLFNSATHISISHTQHEVAVVIHPSHKVGVDIENLDRNFARVATRFLSEREQEHITSPTLQCLAWCAKEAIFKLANEQGVDFATQIGLEQFEEKNEGEIIAHFSGKEKAQNYILRYHILENIALTYGVSN